MYWAKSKCYKPRDNGAQEQLLTEVHKNNVIMNGEWELTPHCVSATKGHQPFKKNHDKLRYTQSREGWSSKLGKMVSDFQWPPGLLVLSLSRHLSTGKWLNDVGFIYSYAHCGFCCWLAFLGGVKFAKIKVHEVFGWFFSSLLYKRFVRETSPAIRTCDGCWVFLDGFQDGLPKWK